jgi:hypothetical protein
MNMSLDLWSPYFLGQLKFAAIAMAGGLVLETVLPGTGKRSYKALAFNLVVAFIFLYLTTLLVPPLSALLDPVRANLSLAIPIRFPDGLLGSLLQTLAFFFLFDFFFYWWHRAQHSNGLLWAQHKFHHQEQWVNVTTVHRYHFSEEMFRVFVVYLPLAVLFDFKPVTVGWIWTAFTLWGYWIHLNVRVDLRGWANGFRDRSFIVTITRPSSSIVITRRSFPSGTVYSGRIITRKELLSGAHGRDGRGGGQHVLRSHRVSVRRMGKVILSRSAPRLRTNAPRLIAGAPVAAAFADRRGAAPEVRCAAGSTQSVPAMTMDIRGLREGALAATAGTDRDPNVRVSRGDSIWIGLSVCALMAGAWLRFAGLRSQISSTTNGTHCTS